MMMKVRHILALALLAIVLAACGDDVKPYEYGDFLYEMVTYSGSDNGRARFSLARRQRDDAALQCHLQHRR